MASVTQTIPQFSLGMSEQPDNLKFPGQVTDIVNAIPDVTKGLFKRPGAKRIGTSPLANVQTGGSWFHYYRDETEGSYIGQVAPNGQVRVWSCNNGQEMTMVYGETTWSGSKTYVTGDTVHAMATSGTVHIYEAQGTNNLNINQQPDHVNGGTVNNWKDMGLVSTIIQNYLQTATPENLQFLTINDTTFVNNRDISNYTTAEINAGGTPSTASNGSARTVTTVGQTGSATQRPDSHFAMLELLRTENGRQYGVDIFKTAEVTVLNRATRISIQDDTLDETDGTGHCPGIGTQVFSLNYSLNDTSATFATSDVNSDTNNLVTVTTSTPHKLNTGNTVSITPNTTQNQFVTLPDVTIAVTGDTTFTYVADSNQGDHTATACTVTHSRNNLIFRINTLGQQGVSPDYNADSNGPDGDNYRCSYQREIVLLHGGEGWVTGNTGTVTLSSASGGGPMRNKWNTSATYNANDLVRNNGNTYKAKTALTDANTEPTHSSTTGDTSEWEFIVDTDSPSATYTIRVDEFESTQVNATVTSNGDGLIRPEPTPFDAQSAVTADTIIGGIIAQKPSDINAKQIGNGIYFSSSNPFTVNVVENDLMRVMQGTVNDVQDLPNQCKHGYIVKVSNALRSEEDDYYLKFEGENDKDGSGSWTECASPKNSQGNNLTTTLTNMPLVIQRTTTANTFVVKHYTYAIRRVGDEFTNPMPSFVGKPINKVLFFRNRLAFLAGENVITSRPGTLGEPDFFIETALTVSVADPVDISAASMFPSDLFDGIEINAGLLVFSTNQQFLLASDDTVFNPDTAKLRSISTFNYNENLAPISLGTTVAYLDNSGKFSRFNEMANTAREGEPNVIEVSKVVPSLLPKNIDLITNSRENSIVLMGQQHVSDTVTPDSDTVYGYKYFQTADKRVQAAWFKWKLNNPLIYHFIINDEYFFLDNDDFLQSINLVQEESDPSTDQDGVNFLLHLDNYTTVGVHKNYDLSTNITTFSNVSWLTSVTTPNHELAIIEASTARYGKPTYSSGTTFTLPGNWTREVSSIIITNGGSGYTSAPTVNISGGAGTGATATATITNGAVTAITITNGGYNFGSTPTVSFSGGGGSNAAATAVISNPIYTIGYLYPYQVKLPTLYPTKVEGQRSTADVNSSLVLHRIKLHFGKIGLYETTLERVGKTNYTEIYESAPVNAYDAADAPYLAEFIKTIPVYERNTNVEVILNSTHPAPATLRSLSWEGDYSPKYYRRV